MFAAVVPGRPVQTDFVPQAENRAIMFIDNISTAQHVTVFLTGTIPLAEGMGASVYMSIHPFTVWQFLGYLSAEKPSALFRFRWPQDALQRDLSAQLGISLEPMDVILQKEAERLAERRDPTAGASAELVNRLGMKLMSNLYNFLTSHAASVPGLPGQWIPATVIDRWLQSFEERVRNNPTFWDDVT